MFAPLSSQVQALTDVMRAFVLNVRPYKKAPRLLLSANGGMHDQCTKTVRLHDIRIGSDAECDFILLDPEIAGQHAMIAVCHSMIGPLATITATGGQIAVNGHDVEKGQTSRHMQLPLSLAIADGITVTLAKHRTASHQLGPMALFMRRLTRTMALLGVATIGVLVWDTFYTTKFAIGLNQGAQQATDDIAASSVDLATFKAKLTDMGLDSALTVQETKDGTLIVRGRLSPNQSKQWAEFSQWYDSVSYAKPMVVHLESTEELPKMPPVSMVRLSDPKEIILKTGESMAVDHVFSGAWKVAAIENDHIVIARGNDVEKLMFARPSNE
ncbi:MAG: FHA domain-containing protein [Roseovarius sp.]|uniref:FHA domain-containing protein n=1 Tax=Roseovarius sp. TaxID=1486281 RepID=UPI001B77671E|nr:FHA domain-containing protein [Roseovarius sp.]MBQ0750721.1 FHA domain-containing protein [Roseovarius sp.]MBQ0811846.1 FHA domain-containing protein [Roseovarius sp.]